MRDGQGVGRWQWAGLVVAVVASAGAAPAADAQAGGIDWVPLVVFGAVILCVFPLLLVCFGMRRRHRAAEDDGMEWASAREPARLPVDLAAVHERAPTGPASRRSDGVTPVLDALPADAEPEAGVRSDLPKPPPAEPERPRSVPPGGLAARCSKCRWAIMAGGTPRLWCPNCGADLQLVFDEVRPEPPANATVPAAEAERLTPPPYFHGRTERGYRVYVLPDELLFLERHGARDVADAEELRAMAAKEPNSHRIPNADLAAVSVEALTFWQRCGTEKIAARLHLDHPEHGRTTVVLPESEDVRRALQLLPGVFGERLRVNAVWNYTQNRWVPQA